MAISVWHYNDHDGVGREELIEVETRGEGQAMIDRPAPGTFVKWHSTGPMVSDGKRASYDRVDDDSWRYDGYRMRY